jgi:hypothetical protein
LYLESGFNVEAADMVEIGQRQVVNHTTRQRLVALAAEIRAGMVRQ